MLTMCVMKLHLPSVVFLPNAYDQSTFISKTSTVFQYQVILVNT